MFAEANAFVPAGQGYQVLTLALSDGAADILLVPGGPTLPEQSPASELLDWLRTACARVPRYGSICTGAFLLGHAGLLDGQRVTSHWSDGGCWRRCFPWRWSSRIASMSAMGRW